MVRELKLNNIPTSCGAIFRFLDEKISISVILKEKSTSCYIGFNKFTRHDSSAHYVGEKGC